MTGPLRDEYRVENVGLLLSLPSLLKALDIKTHHSRGCLRTYKVAIYMSVCLDGSRCRVRVRHLLDCTTTPSDETSALFAQRCALSAVVP